MFIQRIKNKLRNTAVSLRYGIPQCEYAKEWHIKPDNRFLLLSPHPDDESIGCGGFLLKYGKQSDVVLLTNGCHGDPSLTPQETTKIRKSEFEEVMRKLEVRKFVSLDIEDGRLIESFDVFKTISLIGYDYVLIPSPSDNHIDHIAVSPMFYKLASLWQIAGIKVVYYEIWSALSQPTHYLDISDVSDKKRDIINIYKSQIKFVDYASRILALNHYRGMAHYTQNVQYEEDFLIR